MFQLAKYVKQFGSFQRNARLYLLSNALSGVTGGIILVIYSLYLDALGYRTDFIGLLLSVGTVGAGISIFPAGLCIDRFSGRSILIWSSVLISVVGAGQFLLRTPVPLMISVFVVGIGGAFLLVLNAPFLTANSAPAERAHLFSLNIVLGLITTVIGEMLGGALPLWLRSFPGLLAPLPATWAWLLARDPVARSYQLTLLLAGIIAAPSFIPLFLMSNDHPTTHGRVALRQQLRMIFALWRTWIMSAGGERAVGGMSVADGVAGRWRRSVTSLKEWRSWSGKPMTSIIVVQALVGLGAGFFIPYFNLYFVKHLGASSALFGVIDGCANGLNAVFMLLAPWLAQRIGKLATILWPRLLSLPVLLAIGLTNFLPLAIVLYPLRQGLMDMSQGILQVFSMEVVEKQQRGLANSSYQAAFQVAGAVGVSVGGVLILSLGYTSVFLAAAVLYALALFILWRRFGGRGVQPQEEETAAEKAQAG